MLRLYFVRFQIFAKHCMKVSVCEQVTTTKRSRKVSLVFCFFVSKHFIQCRNVGNGIIKHMHNSLMMLKSSRGWFRNKKSHICTQFFCGEVLVNMKAFWLSLCLELLRKWQYWCKFATVLLLILVLMILCSVSYSK